MAQPIAPQIQFITTHRHDAYQDKVIYTYDDPEGIWHKALGNNLSFQFGLFDEAELTRGPQPGPVGPSEFRLFDRQLELANLLETDRPPMKRILDLGCGWGYISRRLASHFPECPRIDAINISQRQLDYCAENLPEDLKGRINLYFCNGQDVDQLPEPEIPYDLVVVRGVYTHFLHDVFETSVANVAQRMRPGGTLVISDTLYKGDISAYKSPIPDKSDRLACGNRKTPEYFAEIVKQNGFNMPDMRVMPSNAEVIHWFQKVRLNIDQHFPDGVTGPIQELHEMARSFTKSLGKEKASVYSIIAQRNFCQNSS